MIDHVNNYCRIVGAHNIYIHLWMKENDWINQVFLHGYLHIHKYEYILFDSIE